MQIPDNPKRGGTFCYHAEGLLKPLCKTDGLHGKRNRGMTDAWAGYLAT